MPQIVRNLYQFIEEQINFKKYTTNLGYSFCREEKLKTRIICNIVLNKIKIIYIIHKSLIILFHKNYYKSLSVNRILIFYLIITKTRLIYYSNLYFSSIRPDFVIIYSVVGYFLIFCLFVILSVTIKVKNLIFIAVFI